MNYPKNLSQFLKVAPKLTLTMESHSWFPFSQLIDVPRKIKTVQTKAVQFEGVDGRKGSWLFLNNAKEVKFENGTMTINLDPNTNFEEIIVYKIS